MRIKKDLKEFVLYDLEGCVESHIEAYCGHYAGMSAKEAAYEFDVNYDWASELDMIEDLIGRELSESEGRYVFNNYLKLFEKVYGDSMQEGYRLQTGYYLHNK